MSYIHQHWQSKLLGLVGISKEYIQGVQNLGQIWISSKIGLILTCNYKMQQVVTDLICCCIRNVRFCHTWNWLDCRLYNHGLTRWRASEVKRPPCRSGPMKTLGFTWAARTNKSSRSLSSCSRSRGDVVKSHSCASRSRSRDLYPKLELPIREILGPSSSLGRLHHKPFAWKVQPGLSYS